MALLEKKMDYKQEFEEILSLLKKNNSTGVLNVVNAFNLAEKLHGGQLRKDGEPYISHPVAVAKILAKLDFDSDMIAAALLHDVVEDCGYTLKEMREAFNDNVAEIVDAVTHLEDNEAEIKDIFYDENFKKDSLDDQTFHKLISLGKQNKLAFYIKFADRLHNLRTIGIFSEYKQVEKVKETQKWIIPLAYLLRSKYFYDNLKDECFKILNKDLYVDLKERYDTYFLSCKDRIVSMCDNLNYKLSNYFSKKSYIFNKVVYERDTLYSICERMKKNLEINSTKHIRRNSFNRVPTVKLFMLFNGNIKESLFHLVYELFETGVLGEDLKIIGYEKNNRYKIHHLIVQDRSQIKYRITAMTMEQYVLMRNGTTESSEIDLIDEHTVGDFARRYITVKTRSGEEIKLPENSTVLDFAFKVHNDLGLSCKYALINKSPNPKPPYTRLVEGDQVVVYNETDSKTGLLKPIAEIRWFAYVVSENAKKVLIKYFEKKYQER